jgi:hypothetical protein
MLKPRPKASPEIQQQKIERLRNQRESFPILPGGNQSSLRQGLEGYRSFRFDGLITVL